jgi:hypothetical protein
MNTYVFVLFGSFLMYLSVCCCVANCLFSRKSVANCLNILFRFLCFIWLISLRKELHFRLILITTCHLLCDTCFYSDYVNLFFFLCDLVCDHGHMATVLSLPSAPLPWTLCKRELHAPDCHFLCDYDF